MLQWLVKNIIILFGPPGSGKTTIISTAKQKGMFAIDLEEIKTTVGRKKYIQKLFSEEEVACDILIGAADLHQNDFPNYVETVLLLPQKKRYLEQVGKRDKLQPEKAGQQAERVYDSFVEWKSNFTRIIEEDGSPDEILAIILDKGR